jgi:hypothetical protein
MLIVEPTESKAHPLSVSGLSRMAARPSTPASVVVAVLVGALDHPMRSVIV